MCAHVCVRKGPAGRGRGQGEPISEPSASQREAFSVQENSECRWADASPNGQRSLGGGGGSGSHLYWAPAAAQGPGTPLLSREVAECNWATSSPPGRRMRSGPLPPTGRRGWGCCLKEGDTGHGTVGKKRQPRWSWREDAVAPGPEELTDGKRGRSGGRDRGAEAQGTKGTELAGATWVTSSISGRRSWGAGQAPTCP